MIPGTPRANPVSHRKTRTLRIASSVRRLADTNPVTKLPVANARGSGKSADGADKLLGERYALLVGVAKYPKTSGLRDLQFTENDAEDLAEALRSSGYRPENIVVMSHKQGAANPQRFPTSALIRENLRSLLRDRTQDDSVLIAFAGHGVQFRGADESFFCPTDGKVDDKASLVSLKDVYGELDQCKAGFKLLLNDACRNDPFVAGSRRASVDLESLTRPAVLAPPGGLAVLFSCSENEVAWENEKFRHGVFFHFVIQGLKGEADFDGDRQVTLEELSLYTKKRVPDLVRAEYDGARQMPHLVGNTRGLVPLTSIAKPILPLSVETNHVSELTPGIKSPTLVQVTELGTLVHHAPWITQDGLAIYWEGPQAQIWTARRNSAGSPFWIKGSFSRGGTPPFPMTNWKWS